ncbi:fumarylacetoacetate hydrolase family protein [Rubrivirga sp. IMCC43871]|uniref:fumarylacetoacetate hydrolase family protein n=1 Tax=Rubrivirga sp. IMCC43871 TaxID=3391575 RepID=UPI00399020B7
MILSLPDGREVRPGKVLCIGRNYVAHVIEMGGREGDQPVVFLKPATALVGSGGEIVLPGQSADVHHEVELVAVIGTEGKNIEEADALGHVAAYALGLDMTARDLQAEAKKGGKPWSVAKGFDTFAPLGPLVDAAEIPDPQAIDITLAIDGEVRQQGSTALMAFSVARIVAYVSTVFTLEPGDLIYTGTPEGVGPVRDGETLVATGSGLPTLTVTARREAAA